MTLLIRPWRTKILNDLGTKTSQKYLVKNSQHTWLWRKHLKSPFLGQAWAWKTLNCRHFQIHLNTRLKIKIYLQIFFLCFSSSILPQNVSIQVPIFQCFLLWSQNILKYLLKILLQIYSNICLWRFESLEYICIFIWGGFFLLLFNIFENSFEPFFN